MVTVLALPVSAPTKLVDVTLVSPASVVAVPPRLTEVLPIVSDEFVRLALAMLLRVLLEPLMVLFVSVSVVARPTSVSVLVGSVSVPVLLIELITGLVSVKPATVVAVLPRLTDVEPMVTDELVRLALAMLLSVLLDPLIVLLVSVSVVCLLYTSDAADE